MDGLKFLFSSGTVNSSLRDLDVSVEVVGEVGEVESEGVLDAEPARLVVVGGGAAAHHLVLELGLRVFQQEPDRLSELHGKKSKYDAG